jgi:peptidoglycan hydrolase-like protein with peptidoglycan-binding domain
MKKASFLVIGILGFFLALVWFVGAQTAPVGYSQHGDFFCSNDPNLEKPASASGRKFCQPQATACQAVGNNFCTAGTRNVCCPADNVCGKGTALRFWEVAVCVPPLTCNTKSTNYAGTTKEGKNVCCRVGEEPGPAGKDNLGTDAPYCQPKSASTCAPGELFVQGLGSSKHKGEKRCCALGTTPSHHSNGLPFCAKLPLHVLAPNGGEQIPQGSYQVKWSSNNLPSTQQIKLKLLTSSGAVRYQNTFSNTGSVTLNFQSPPGQYKIEVSAVVNGKTISDQSDNFFTLIVPPDTTPPALFLQLPRLGQTRTNQETRILTKAEDQNGVRSSSIGVKAPGGDSRLQSCTNQFQPGLMYCTLTVPGPQWVNGTVIVLSAMDSSPQRNVTLQAYIATSGQLQLHQSDKGDSGAKVIIPPPTPTCHTFNTNLSIGMTGSEVMALQTALTRAGFAVNATGNFDEATASAVSSFQLAHKIELLTAKGLTYPTGYFGPATRQKLNRLWGCGNMNQ